MEPQQQKIEIRTKRLLLREVHASDAPRITELIGNWNVIRWLSRPPYAYRLADAEAFIAGRNQVDRQSFIIEIDGLLAGVIGFSPMERGINLGYWLAEPYWGRGYMTEAAVTALDYCFSRMGLDEIVSGLFKGNDGSLRIQKKLGFEIVDVGEAFSVPLGRSLVHIDTRLTRARFEAARSQAGSLLS